MLVCAIKDHWQIQGIGVHPESVEQAEEQGAGVIVGMLRKITFNFAAESGPAKTLTGANCGTFGRQWRG